MLQVCGDEAIREASQSPAARELRGVLFTAGELSALVSRPAFARSALAGEGHQWMANQCGQASGDLTSMAFSSLVICSECRSLARQGYPSPASSAVHTAAIQRQPRHGSTTGRSKVCRHDSAAPMCGPRHFSGAPVWQQGQSSALPQSWGN